jgi:hypothetical protein
MTDKEKKEQEKSKFVAYKIKTDNIQKVKEYLNKQNKKL